MSQHNYSHTCTPCTPHTGLHTPHRTAHPVLFPHRTAHPVLFRLHTLSCSHPGLHTLSCSLTGLHTLSCSLTGLHTLSCSLTGLHTLSCSHPGLHILTHLIVLAHPIFLLAHLFAGPPFGPPSILLTEPSLVQEHSLTGLLARNHRAVRLKPFHCLCSYLTLEKCYGAITTRGHGSH
jgi:hypothetical protein